ncbi:unnamed protein product [Darwinula stevensoni]|uniref:Uncharacterized protein n=1 Tax=Darwinula stevensoni TaxID=69355 RepID=A0A7R9A819_9CRUS|nr:unnamed protein product [Darwinula stevensoni]CAG0894589.1 unnamed protein product [Darwinula stevensoni]
MFSMVMLRFLLCLAAFLPAAFGAPLETFEDLVRAFRAGHRVAANFDTRLCEHDDTPEPFLASVHFSQWEYEETADLASVIAIESFVTQRGTFVLLIMVAGSDGGAEINGFEVSFETDLIVDSFLVACTVGLGAFFVEKGNHQPDTAVGSYDQLMTVLTDGRQLSIVLTMNECEGFVEPEVNLAEFGSSYYQFYVIPDETGDGAVIVEWPGLFLSQVQDETVYSMLRLIVGQDGSVSFRGNYYNTQTWQDEFFDQEGFQCVLGESANFYFAADDAYDSFGTYSELSAAFFAGKEIQAAVNIPMCTPIEGNLPGILYAGTKVELWERWFSSDILFYQSIVNLAGEIVQQVFTLDGEEILVAAETVNPADPGAVPETVRFSCPIGSGSMFSAPAFDQSELREYALVVKAELSGAKLSAQLNFSECVDVSGMFTYGIVRAHLQNLLVRDLDTEEETLFASAFSGRYDADHAAFTYEVWGVSIDGNNQAKIFPGFWDYNPLTGEFLNLFEEVVVECTLGEGLIISEEA